MTPEQVEEVERFWPWLRKVAAGMTTSDQAEDLAQEGWIATWKATQSYNGKAPLDWWLKRKAHGRMLTLVSRDWKSGKATQDVACGHPAYIDSEEPDPIWDQSFVDLPAAEMVYHAQEIREALDELTPREREYIVMRFWGGRNYPELTEYFGYQPQGLWRTSRQKLTESLAHLKDAA